MQRLTHLVPRTIIMLLILGIIGSRFIGLHTVEYTYVNSTLPKQYNGFVVAHVNNIGNSGGVTSEVSKMKPDIILVTGDISKDGKANSGIKTVEKLAKIAPTYYTLGLNDDPSIVNQIASAKYVDNTCENVNIEEQKDALTYIKDTYGDEMVKLVEKEDEQALAYLKYTEDKLAEDYKKNIRILGIPASLDETFTDNALIEMYKQDYESILDIGITSCTDTYSTISNYEIGLLFSGESNSIKSGEHALNGTTLLVSKSSSNGIYTEVQQITLSDGTLNDDNLLEKFLGLFIKDVGTIFDNDGGFQEHKYEYTSDEHLHF